LSFILFNSIICPPPLKKTTKSTIAAISKTTTKFSASATYIDDSLSGLKKYYRKMSSFSFFDNFSYLKFCFQTFKNNFEQKAETFSEK
jgi:hypothetical protein